MKINFGFAGVLLLIFGIAQVHCEGSSRDVCKLQPLPGIGKAFFPMFYYKASAKECRQFAFGGIDIASNGNKFETCEECREACNPKAKCSDTIDSVDAPQA